MIGQLTLIEPSPKRGVVSLEQALDTMALRLSRERGYTLVRTGNHTTGYQLERAL